MIQLIGYGNPGRGDDGLGPAFAARIADAPELLVRTDYQLTVDHALLVAEARRVVFVDALMHSKKPFEFARIIPSTTHDLTSHSITPAVVLGLCETLFGTSPEAFVLGITGYEFGEVREGLSQRSNTNLALADTFFRNWLDALDATKKAAGYAHA